MAVSWQTGYLRYKQYFMNISLFYRKREDVRMFLEILLTLLAIAFFVLGAIRPTLLTIAQLVNDIKEKEKTLAEMESKITNLNKAKNLYSREFSKISLLDSAIPNSPDPLKYSRQLEALVQKNSLVLKKFTLGRVSLLGTSSNQQTANSQEVNDFKSFSISLDVQGDYPLLTTLFSQLENLRRPYVLESATFSIVPQENQILLSITGLVPYLESSNLNQ